MQPMDKSTLFSIFEQGDEEVYTEHGLEETLSNPFVLMGMVLRGIENYHLMDIMYQRNFPNEYKAIRLKLKYKYYNKLYGYLQRIDSSNFNSIYKIGESFEKGEAYVGLDHLRTYFERIEEYEKCGVIKKYQELLSKQVYE